MVNIPQELIEKLRHPDHNKRSDAVFAINQIDNPQKLSIFIQALRTEPDLYVREDITFVLMNMGKIAIDPLLTLLDDEDANIRHHAVHVLGKIGDAKAVPALVRLLGHNNRVIQTALLNIMTHFGEVPLPFLKEAIHNGDWQVREQVVDALGVLGHPDSVQTLIDVLDDEHWRVRFAVITALHNIGGKMAKEAIDFMIYDDDQRVRKLAETLCEQTESYPIAPVQRANYHKLIFASMMECSAYLASLSHIFNAPHRIAYHANLSDAEVWVCTEKSQNSFAIYLNTIALQTSVRVFGETPITKVSTGDTLAHCTFILGGENQEALGLNSVKRHLLKILKAA